MEPLEGGTVVARDWLSARQGPCGHSVPVGASRREWLRQQYPKEESLRVSHETIYRSLFIQAHPHDARYINRDHCRKRIHVICSGGNIEKRGWPTASSGPEAPKFDVPGRHTRGCGGRSGMTEVTEVGF